jgi:hypothetical protein
MLIDDIVLVTEDMSIWSDSVPAIQAWYRIKKFCDEELKHSHNTSVMPCRMHDCGEACFLEFKSRTCGREPCQLSART